jgi:uncharacterized ion transporter superfamily protein YfcC
MKNFKIPHVFIFLSAIILFSSILTYIIPNGKFERTTHEVNNVNLSLVIAGRGKYVIASSLIMTVLTGFQSPKKF